MVGGAEALFARFGFFSFASTPILSDRERGAGRAGPLSGGPVPLREQQPVFTLRYLSPFYAIVLGSKGRGSAGMGYSLQWRKTRKLGKVGRQAERARCPGHLARGVLETKTNATTMFLGLCTPHTSEVLEIATVSFSQELWPVDMRVSKAIARRRGTRYILPAGRVRCCKARNIAFACRMGS